MAKYYETSTVFDYSWNQVARGLWNRYPNPHRLISLSANSGHSSFRFYYIKAFRNDTSLCSIFLFLAMVCVARTARARIAVRFAVSNENKDWFWIFFIRNISQHVLSEDTIDRYVQDGKLYSKRLLTKTNHVPKWGERFYNAKSVKIIEESVCDPKTKTLTTYTRNIAFTKVMVSATWSAVQFIESHPVSLFIL